MKLKSLKDVTIDTVYMERPKPKEFYNFLRWTYDGVRNREYDCSIPYDYAFSLETMEKFFKASDHKTNYCRRQWFIDHGFIAEVVEEEYYWAPWQDGKRVNRIKVGERGSLVAEDKNGDFIENGSVLAIEKDFIWKRGAVNPRIGLKLDDQGRIEVE